MNWKIMGPSALINAALTIVLSIVFLPISFLGPIVGGFLASYFTKGYEDYEGMDEKDGAVVGAISGLVGGLIIALLFIIGIGDISAVSGFISSKIGAITGGTIIAGYIILELSVILSFILGLIGGIIGVAVKK